MNKREKEVLGSYLDDEKKTLNYLKQVYKKSAEDIRERIAYFSAREDMNDPHLASIIYQKQYQRVLLKEIEAGLKDLNENQYKTLDEFFKGSYVNGYVGSMYNFEGQGIPLTVPIDPKKMVRAVQTDSKLSKKYYQKRLFPENVERLKLSIKAEVSRGIASGSSWLEVANKVAKNMNSPFNRALNDAVRIVRTEGHRINQEGYLDAGDEAKKKGADILKQWDATLDSRTRPWHQEADGQIREWDDDFTVNGEKMKAPSVGGSASNVINCRCQLLQRARWALDEDELKTLEDRAKFYGLDKSKDFEDFRQKYLKLPENAESVKIPTPADVLKKPVEGSDPHYKSLKEGLTINKIEYNPVEDHTLMMTDEQIIEALSGGDMTQGSCASLGLAYIGQKQGWNVLDFRDGKSRDYFSRSGHLYSLAKMKGIVASFYGDVKGKSACTLANNFLKTLEEGKEYYLCVGRHASIVRKKDGVLQYLELQSSFDSGWTKFNGNPRYTLTNRFGCSSASGHGEIYDFMINITDSDFDNEEFKSLLGFLNTAEDKQKKGKYGSIR